MISTHSICLVYLLIHLSIHLSPYPILLCADRNLSIRVITLIKPVRSIGVDADTPETVPPRLFTLHNSIFIPRQSSVPSQRNTEVAEFLILASCSQQFLNAIKISRETSTVKVMVIPIYTTENYPSRSLAMVGPQRRRFQPGRWKLSCIFIVLIVLLLPYHQAMKMPILTAFTSIVN